MLVSEREMGLSDEHEGIIELPEETEIGTPFADIFGMNDPVIDIAVTPDRADCAGVRGIARDLAAGGLGELKPLDTKPVEGNYKSSVDVKITSGEQCPLFLGRMVKGVKNAESPKWMQDRLKAIGLRPISALVDITNYMSIDLCRPLHVYDVAKLKGDIDVRLSKEGESFEALNDKSYILEEGMTAITDESGVLGLGRHCWRREYRLYCKTQKMFLSSVHILIRMRLQKQAVRFKLNRMRATVLSAALIRPLLPKQWRLPRVWSWIFAVERLQKLCRPGKFQISPVRLILTRLTQRSFLVWMSPKNGKPKFWNHLVLP